jgi:hypothetical protein
MKGLYVCSCNPTFKKYFVYMLVIIIVIEKMVGGGNTYHIASLYKHDATKSHQFADQ